MSVPRKAAIGRDAVMGVDLKACVPHADMGQGGRARFMRLLEIRQSIESD